MDTMRADQNQGYWVGRPKQDDDGNDIVEDLTPVIVDEGGIPTDLQPVTGYEVTVPEPVEHDPVEADYPENWGEIAKAFKDKRDWRCESCGFTRHGSPAIQVHHVDHDKADCSDPNLQVLCLTCHKTKHGGGSGMGVQVPAHDRAALDAWNRTLRMQKLDKKLVGL